MTDSRLAVPLLPGWLRWLGVAAVGLFILYFSVLTVPPETTVVPGRPGGLALDKWRHVLAYAALGGALAYATVDWDRSTRVVALAAVAVVVTYGVGIELWQSLLPERYFGLDDAAANALGGVLSLPLFALRDRLPFAPVGELLASFRE